MKLNLIDIIICLGVVSAAGIFTIGFLCSQSAPSKARGNNPHELQCEWFGDTKRCVNDEVICYRLYSNDILSCIRNEGFRK